MGTLYDFFNLTHPLVVFVYGQTFFIMGMAIMMQSRHHSRLRLARDLRWLALFGILHGVAEWGNVFIPTQSIYLSPHSIDALLALRIVLLAASFVCLLVFGAVTLNQRWPWVLKAVAAVTIVWGMIFLITVGSTQNSDTWYPVLSIWAGYLLGLPGSLLAAYGLRYQVQSNLAPSLGRGDIYQTLRIVGFALVVYAILGGVIVPAGGFFPANILNLDTIQKLIGIPVEVFRSIVGLVLAVSVIRALEIFDIEVDQLIESMEIERIQTDTRERIGQEINDGAMQEIYAASLILDTIAPPEQGGEQFAANVDRAKRALDSAISDLRRSMVSVRATAPTEPLTVSLQKLIDDPRYSSLLRIRSRIDIEPDLKPIQVSHLLAIIQESLSNITRHAGAHQAAISLSRVAEGLQLCIEDDGQGFDELTTTTGFGIRAMRDHARLLGGKLNIESRSGKGTTIRLNIPEDILGT